MNYLRKEKLEAVGEIVEVAGAEQNKAMLSKQLNEHDKEKGQINTASGLVNTQTEEALISSTTNVQHESSIQAKSPTTVNQ